jgi:immune inhibitor A
MRKSFLALLAGALAVVLSVGVGASMAGGSAAVAADPAVRAKDNISSPLAEKQAALHAQALEMQAKGQIPKGAKVGKVAKGQYVELTREGEDSIFTVLGQFGNAVSPTYGGTAGPQRNQIPEPDRTTDNTTIWTSDFSKDYYDNLLFGEGPGANSMRAWYIEQSSGRYAVNGEVTDWVDVPNNEAYYGANYCGSIVCARTWLFVRDSLNAWYNAQVAAGKTADQINAELAKYDVWDRYDQDGDGNFNEPDGYIDHFQAIHAGVGEETGGGAQGTNAIWSHRWYVQLTPIGGGGPTLDDGTTVPFGGVRIGNSKYWVGDYTIEPENGGVGVFSHEFGHDLGLPDEYDTSGNTGGAENSTGFWTNWSSGSYGNNGDPAEGIGDRPFHANAWDKLFLGWLNYEAVFPGDKKKEIKLGPAEANTKQAQAAIVVLPDKSVTKNVGQPFAGAKFYYSGAANNLTTEMTRSVTLPAGASLSAKVRYNIEVGYDAAYVTVNGSHVTTNLSNSSAVDKGIDGYSNNNWVTLTADLSAYAGQTVTLGFGYYTDGGVQGANGGSPAGVSIDDIAITGQSIDGAESDAGWNYSTNGSTGFHSTTGSETFKYFNAYIAENRQYLGYDAGLQTGPYNFGGTVGPNWAERFPYQDGMLVWYYDSSYEDNNVGDHPGEGLILPVDAHPEMLHSASGAVMRPRLQSFDSTFSLQATDPITLHLGGVGVDIPSRPGVSVFDDTNSYYVSSDPGDAPGGGRYQSSWSSVNTPHTGTRIRIQSETPGGFMQVEVTPPK